MKRERTTVEINDLETLELLNDPLRMRIIMLMDEPTPVKDVATELGVPVTRLYYHVNMLEEAGLIKVTETRKVGAMLQKLYQAAGTGYVPGKDLLADIDDPHKFASIAASTVLDAARLDVEEGLIALYEEHGPGGTPEEVAKTVALGRALFAVPKDRISEYVDKLMELVDEMQVDFDEPDQELYSFSYAMFPVAGNF